MTNLVTPPIGVRAFVSKFGGQRHLMSAARSMGLTVTHKQIAKWIVDDGMPDHLYYALAAIITEDETQIAKGFIEFYVRGEPIGKFYLHKDVSAIIRKRRT